MNLGQMLLAMLSFVLLGVIILGANSAVLETDEMRSESELSSTAVSLATSVIEEAMTKVYDAIAADSNLGVVTSPSSFTGTPGPESGESYKANLSGTRDFDDFDDFNNLKLVFKSDNDGGTIPSGYWATTIPGLRARYNVDAAVDYVQETNLDAVASGKTWVKRITVTVTSPSMKQAVVVPAIMCYWN